MRTEVNLELGLDKTKSHLLDNHSLFNIFNILFIELENLIKEAKEEYLNRHSRSMLTILTNLMNPSINGKLDYMMDAINELLLDLDRLKKEKPEFEDRLQSIFITLEIALVRVEEFAHDRFIWKPISVHEFRNKLVGFLEATERVSRGRFGFAYPPEQASETEYLMDITFETEKLELYAPPVLHDTLRDLTANARKYSRPGTSISVNIRELKPEGLQVSIKDEGLGIPADEIINVVKFESRGSNVGHLKTMGKGFGLTKAYHVAKLFNGRFWIDSELNSGTTIEFELFPVPQESSVVLES